MQQVGQTAFGAMQLVGILTGFVVAEETADEHAAKTVLVLVGDNVEVAHQIVREVILRHLVEQLVLVHRVRLVGQQEHVTDVALEGQRVDLCGVAGIEHHSPSRPNVAHVELAAMQGAALLHATQNHTGHLADLALRIALDHLFHAVNATLCVALVEQTQTLDE